MLIRFKPSVKTSILLLLFIAEGGYLFAGSLNLSFTVQHQFYTSGDNQLIISEPTYSSSGDTVETIQKEELNIHDSLTDQIINFQINSDISYLSLKHFVKDESRNKFHQAWLKDKELSQISAQTDSLRKVYANSTNPKKDEIATLILKNEELSMSLNQEISTLYQTARDQENQYWQSCSADEKMKLQEKIKSFSDSLALRKIKEETEKMAKILIDTILISNESSQGQELKTETIATAIVYKIQIGAFKGKIPESSNNMIKKLSVLRKVENYTDEKGVKIYTTGNLKTYQEAVTLQNQVKKEGVKNSTVIAFQKGKKITIDEARKINNEL